MFILMLRPIAENTFADRQIGEFLFAEILFAQIGILPIFYFPKHYT
jgi:hypothetical protein